MKQLRVNKGEHRTDSDYQIWQDGGKPKQVSSDSIMWQKIEYIHNNPMKRGFVAVPEHWCWSSAGDYAGQPGLIDIDQSWR